MIEKPDAGELMAGPLGAWLATQNASRSEAKAKSRKYIFYGVVGAAGVGILVLIFSQSFQMAAV